MISVTRDRDVPASPEEVAAFVSDLSRWPEWFALWKDWSGEIPTEARVGVKFAHRVRVLGVTGDVTWTVADLDVPHRFHLTGKGPSRSNMDVDFRVLPHGAGSNLSFEAQIGGLAVRPFEGILKPWIEERAQRTVDALERVLAEPAG